MTQVTKGKHGTGARYLRPINGYMMYKDIDFDFWVSLTPFKYIYS